MTPDENKPKPPRADDRDDSSKRTPNADMQADEQTTGESAEDDNGGTAGGTPAERAMKQLSKTDAQGRG